MSQTFRFRKEMYSREALLKAAYQYIDDFYLHLDADDTYYIANIFPRDEKMSVDEKSFLNEILLQETRKTVLEQTKELRTIMYSRAMASTVINELGTEDSYKGENADEILKDWFDDNEE